MKNRIYKCWYCGALLTSFKDGWYTCNACGSTYNPHPTKISSSCLSCEVDPATGQLSGKPSNALIKRVQKERERSKI